MFSEIVTGESGSLLLGLSLLGKIDSKGNTKTVLLDLEREKKKKQQSCGQAMNPSSCREGGTWKEGRQKVLRKQQAHPTAVEMGWEGLTVMPEV